MKKLVLFFVLLLAVWSPTQAQLYFEDDFDSYTVGSYLGPQSSQWYTWSSSTGGNSEDVFVSNADALSGSNSLYFYSANGGGPHDVVLDFGGVHNSGKFVYRANYKIPSKGNSYFNFQGGSGIGQQWSLDFYFYAGGNWNCQGGGGTFPHDQWFELMIDVDFDTDTWRVYIDGNLQATFTNTNPISYLDLYEVSSNSEWYIDDVSFCVNNGCNPELKLENLQISPNSVCTHHESDVSVKVTNNSNFSAPSFVLGIYVGNDTLSQAINLNNLGAGKDTTLTLTGFFKSSTAGVNIPVSAINFSGDKDPSNDTAKTTVTVLPSPSNTMIQKGTPYESSRPNSAGNMADPDIVTAGHTLTYEVVPPTGYNNADYGSTWDMTALTFSTPSGAQLANTFFSFTAPSGSANGSISFSPDASLLDSAIVCSFAVNSLGNGCDSVLKRYINVVPVPDAQFTHTDVCDQEAMPFVNTSTLQSGTMSYLWLFGDGNSSTLANPTHTYATFGSYTVRLFTTSDYGYMDSVDVQVNVNQLPTADFIVTNACEGSDVNFTDNSFLPTGTPTYEWDFGDGSATATGQNIGHSYAIPGNYSIMMTVTINGCSDSKTKYGTQAPRATTAFSSVVACNNATAEFTNSSTLLFGTFGTHWKFGDGMESSAKNASHTYAGFGNFDVTMIITTDLGCVDSSTATITMIESPKPDFSLSNACSEELITINNLTNTPQGGSNSYTWYLGNGQTSTAINPTTSFGGPGVYTVKLVAFNGNGCMDSIMRKVAIDTKPIAAFLASDLCEGEESEFKNNTVNLPNGGAFVWDFGNGANSSATDTSFVYGTAGNYTISLIATTPNGCSDTASKMISINPLPDASFDVQSGLKGDGTMTFSANTPGATEYRWFMSDGAQYMTENVVHRFTSAGTYTAKLVVKSDKACLSETIESVSITPTGVQGLESATLNVYPNPSKGVFTVAIANVTAPKALAIYGVNGQLLQELDINQLQGGTMEVNLDGFAPGVYVLRLNAANGSWNQRLIIE